MHAAARTYATAFARLELDEVDSTNLEALRRARNDECGPLWIVAGRQTAGRGRSGRTWVSCPGNLAATLLIAPGCAPIQLHQLSLVTGVALHHALMTFHSTATSPAAVAPRLKWPNDLLLGGAKLGGVLIESTMAAGTLVAAIGIGVNVVAAPAVEGRATASMEGWQPIPSANMLLTAIDAELRTWLDVWQHGAGFSAIRAAWLERAGPIGEPIAVDTGLEAITGVFAGIDETGALLVSSVPPKPRETRRFTFGDVSLLPPPQDQG